MLPDRTRTRRLDLILRRFAVLSPQAATAVGLLSRCVTEGTPERNALKLVHADPDLAAKVLALCALPLQPVRDKPLAADQVMALRGFGPFRNALLSVRLVELLGRRREPAHDSPASAWE